MFSERMHIRLNRFVRRRQAWHAMRRLDTHPLPEGKPDEVWMIVVCRNEALRLPFMLDYHFKLGVSRVLLLDNASTDATLSLVRDDPRIHVFSSSQKFRGSLYWQEPLLRHFAVGRWCLVLDADELFVYPHMDALRLPDLAKRLDAEGVGALHAIFLEMFSRLPVGHVQYRPGENLLEAAPYFDPVGYVKTNYRRVFHGDGSSFVYMGGTRTRVFGGEFACSKVPFFRYHPRLFLRLGLHTIEGTRVSSAQAALLHFKYLHDFHAKVLRESQRNVYWNGSAEYKAYAAHFREKGDFSLWHPAAQKYNSWRTLQDAGLIFLPPPPAQSVNRPPE